MTNNIIYWFIVNLFELNYIILFYIYEYKKIIKNTIYRIWMKTKLMRTYL